MKFLLICGPQAVGKMTVGQELEKITDLKLFHNHMTIELVSPFFSYNVPAGKRLVRTIREEFFEEVASSSLPGLIFTYQWDFDVKADGDYIESLVDIFRKKGAEIYYVELEASMDERIKRNKTSHRLDHKPTQRDLEKSENRLKENVLTHRQNSEKDQIKEKNYLRINNTNLKPDAVAQMIKEKFNL